jgi:hypothetical protein
MVFTL